MSVKPPSDGGLLILKTEGFESMDFQKMIMALYNRNERITVVYSYPSPSCTSVQDWSDHVFNSENDISKNQILIDKRGVYIPSLSISDAAALANLDSSRNFVDLAVAAVGNGIPVTVTIAEDEQPVTAFLKEINSVKNRIRDLGMQVKNKLALSLDLNIRDYGSLDLEKKIEIPMPSVETGGDMDLSKYIDHTYLKPQGTYEDIDKLCEEAKQYSFKAVCVNPLHIKRCKSNLSGSDVLVATVIGFPLGANLPEVKAFETQKAIEDGADEVDMVLNVGAMKSGDLDLVERDVKAVVDAAGGKTVKVILETCLLNDEEKVKASLISKRAGADFVKTSTGFSTGGATFEDVYLMKKTVGDDLEVKASGGVRDQETALEMIKLGATRLGTSSGVKIVTGEKGGSNESY